MWLVAGLRVSGIPLDEEFGVGWCDGKLLLVQNMCKTCAKHAFLDVFLDVFIGRAFFIKRKFFKFHLGGEDELRCVNRIAICDVIAM